MWEVLGTMRVISQDGTIDVPYENFVFSILNSGGGYGIVAVKNVAEPPEVFMNSLIATYSTKAKAIKAMEMLREKYLSRMELDGGYDIVNKCYVQPNYWVLPKVFQFPQDDEIEV